MQVSSIHRSLEVAVEWIYTPPKYYIPMPEITSHKDVLSNLMSNLSNQRAKELTNCSVGAPLTQYTAYQNITSDRDFCNNQSQEFPILN